MRRLEGPCHQWQINEYLSSGEWWDPDAPPPPPAEEKAAS